MTYLVLDTDAVSILFKSGHQLYNEAYGIAAGNLSAGRPIATADAWVAACARQWGVALVTGNYRHFEHLSDLILVPLGR